MRFTNSPYEKMMQQKPRPQAPAPAKPPRGSRCSGCPYWRGIGCVSCYRELKEQSYNPKLTAARVALAKTESEIEKLLDTLSGANPLLLQYANTRIEELDAERQKQLRLVADLTANSVSASQIDSITGYLDNWESVSFDDKRKVVDILISQIDATSESVTIHWKI